MTEIRLCWAKTITVVAETEPVQSTPWERDTPDIRTGLADRARTGNAEDGPDTYWLEERDSVAAS
jgi:hypothetical protein